MLSRSRVLTKKTIDFTKTTFVRKGLLQTHNTELYRVRLRLNIFKIFTCTGVYIQEYTVHPVTAIYMYMHVHVHVMYVIPTIAVLFEALHFAI